MQRKPATDELLTLIFWNYKKWCGAICSCTKVELFCKPACGSCSGDTCDICPPVVDQYNAENSDESEQKLHIYYAYI